MKNIFSILLVCCVTFAFAGTQPVFDEVDENECHICGALAFAVENPISDADSDEEEIANKEGKELYYAALSFAAEEPISDTDSDEEEIASKEKEGKGLLWNHCFCC